MASEEHDSALRRLEAALAERDRLSGRYEAAKGTASELSAYVRLRAAGAEVVARRRWLEWIGLDVNLAPANPTPAASSLDGMRRARGRLARSHRSFETER